MNKDTFILLGLMFLSFVITEGWCYFMDMEGFII